MPSATLSSVPMEPVLPSATRWTSTRIHPLGPRGWNPTRKKCPEAEAAAATPEYRDNVVSPNNCTPHNLLHLVCNFPHFTGVQQEIYAVIISYKLYYAIFILYGMLLFNT